ncbi:MAG: Gfo/Idh/MocA family oxidoreductase [Phenylobacterium sp.]|uniref:Gfo/Idh/MocA family protein n=1 Tax=Phenylobacterium sp. TaxID=1871053 RepID=UPI0011F91506|nr:Gfo/Idh/MocA family oxidoreductase [Phenylobacterium sp.]TAJ68595.1 MAG: Gfo/Idh/MocA family oxidoreductase [Phenylobacterium sp.]
MTTYRIGVIGLGQRIAHVLAAMKEVGWDLDVVGHADPAPVGAPILATAGIHAGRAFDSPAELLRAGPFDLLTLGAPNHLHFEHLMLALDAGVPIFAEKPIVRTEDETEALARRLAGASPPVYVGLVMRSLPIVRDVLGRVDSGDLGEIVSIDATEHLAPDHGGYIARNWRRKQAWGGSYFLDKVVHDFDVFGRLVGARPERVASFGGRRIFTSERREPPRTYEDGSDAYVLRDAGWGAANDAFQSDMDVTDHQVAMIEYANDVRLSFHANSHTALTERRWYVAGTEGTLIADLVRNKLMVRRALFRGKPEKIEYGGVTADAHNGADQAMALDLLAALEGRGAFPVTPYESMEAGLTVMAIDRAMEERQVVECAPMWARFDAARSGVGEQRLADEVL